jgi:hypothetical protein
MSVGATADRLLLFLLALTLVGCAATPRMDAGQQSTRSQLLADNVPAWAGGEPANAPKRPSAASAYPPVFEVKEARRTKLLTDEEHKKLRDDLVAARERAIARANARTTTAQDESTKDNAVTAQTRSAGEQLATASN